MDGGLMPGSADPMADALDELAEALGLPREGGDGEPSAAPDAVARRDAAVSRVRELA
jgi:hypothetical protein